MSAGAAHVVRRALADDLCGDLGERTTKQLREAGWDPAREPNLDEYLDQI